MFVFQTSSLLRISVQYFRQGEKIIESNNGDTLFLLDYNYKHLNQNALTNIRLQLFSILF